MRAKDFLTENTITLEKLYGGEYPDRDEKFWNFISGSDLEKPLEVQTMQRHILQSMLLNQYGVEHVEELEDMLNDDQKEIIDHYLNSPNLSSEVIVISDGQIIDGNHRALAAVLKGLPINYVSFDEDELTETEERKLGPSLKAQGYEFDYVKIYRAVLSTVNTFKAKDYVTRSIKFAKEHADHVQAVEGEPSHVIQALVKAADVYDAYNPGEYFYNGPEVKGKTIYTPNFEELDENWKKALATATVAGGLALGGYAAKDPAPNASVNVQTMQEPKRILPLPKPIEPAVFRQVGNSLKRPLAQILIKEAQAAGLGGVELAQFLAQCAHETHDFRDLKEWGGRNDHKRYDIKYNPGTARVLGNTKPGDGFKYIGRGFIQLTGKYNYGKAEKELKIPLLTKPELLERPDIAAKVAVWYWKHRVSPKVDDFSDTLEVTRPINSRLAGVENRESRFKAIAELFGLNV